MIPGQREGLKNHPTEPLSDLEAISLMGQGPALLSMAANGGFRVVGRHPGSMIAGFDWGGQQRFARCRQLALNGCTGRSANTSAVRGCPVVSATVPVLLSLTQMYGAAVRCKRFDRSVGLRSCINVSGL
jgi:hypothetical protein